MTPHRFVSREAAESYLRERGFAPDPQGERWVKVESGLTDYADLRVIDGATTVVFSHARFPRTR